MLRLFLQILPAAVKFSIKTIKLHFEIYNKHYVLVVITVLVCLKIVTLTAGVSVGLCLEVNSNEE